MNTINIGGILFTPESLESLREWISPEYSEDETAIAADIEAIDQTQSFLLYHWDDFNSESDKKIKKLLTGLQYIKERLNALSQVGNCRNSISDTDSPDNQ